MYFLLGRIPIKSEAKIACSLPVCANLIVLFEYADEMLNVFLVDILTPKSSAMRLKLMERQLCCQ